MLDFNGVFWHADKRGKNAENAEKHAENAENHAENAENHAENADNYTDDCGIAKFFRGCGAMRTASMWTRRGADADYLPTSSPPSS